jgi:hypothetical protein
MSLELTKIRDEFNAYDSAYSSDYHQKNGLAALKINQAINYLKEKITAGLNFDTEAQVKQYFGEARLFGDEIFEKIKYCEFHNQKDSRERDGYVDFNEFWFFKLSRMLSYLFFGYVFYQQGTKEYYRLSEKLVSNLDMLMALGSIFIELLVIAFVLPYVIASIPYIIGGVKHDNIIASKVYDNPEWFLIAEKNLSILIETLQVSELESIESVRSKRATESLRSEYKIKEEFNKSTTEDKLRIIREELEATIRLSRSQEEQHERTEEVRIKYAKEMMAIQKEAIQDNDKNLMDKLHVINAIFEG